MNWDYSLPLLRWRRRIDRHVLRCDDIRGVRMRRTKEAREEVLARPGRYQELCRKRTEGQPQRRQTRAQPRLLT